MTATDLTGQGIGEDADGLAPWIITHKAPAQQRVRFWTVAHSPCGTAVDLPQTLLQQAIKGKSSLPPCTSCTPAASLPAISHGMHIACGAMHLLGSPCPDGVQREPNASHGPNNRINAVDGAGAERKMLTGDALNLVGAIVKGSETAALKAGRAVDLAALPDEPELHPFDVVGLPDALDPYDQLPPPGGVEREEGVPLSIAPAELAQAYAEPLVAPDLTLDRGELVVEVVGVDRMSDAIEQASAALEPTAAWVATLQQASSDLLAPHGVVLPDVELATGGLVRPGVVHIVGGHGCTLPPVPEGAYPPGAVSLDVEVGQHVPHATAPSVIVAGPCDRLDAPQDVLEVIKGAMRAHPRSAQAEVGPSELGGCERKLGHRLAFGKVEREPGWRPQVGTAVHTWLGKVFARQLDAGRAPGDRWLADYRVSAPVAGTLDLFDARDGRVIDFKVVGKSTLDRARRGHVDDKYVGQVQLYGLGMAHDGYDVKRVALLYLPASGELSDAAWWESDYDPAVGQALVARRDKVRAMLAVGAAMVHGDVEAAASVVLPLLEFTEDHCGFCPARGTHCPGATPAPAPALTLARA